MASCKEQIGVRCWQITNKCLTKLFAKAEKGHQGVHVLLSSNMMQAACVPATLQSCDFQSVSKSRDTSSEVCTFSTMCICMRSKKAVRTQQTACMPVHVLQSF